MEESKFDKEELFNKAVKYLEKRFGRGFVFALTEVEKIEGGEQIQTYIRMKEMNDRMIACVINAMVNKAPGALKEMVRISVEEMLGESTMVSRRELGK